MGRPGGHHPDSRWRRSTSRSGICAPRLPICRYGAFSAAPRSRNLRPTTPISAGCPFPRTRSSKEACAPSSTTVFGRLKLKVGHADPMIDIERIEAVRKAVGPSVTIAVDANGKWDLPTCQRFCARAEAARSLLVRGANVVRRRGLACGTGAFDRDSGRARRAALHGRCVRELHRRRSGALRPARRDAPRLASPNISRSRIGRMRTGFRSSRMSATWARCMCICPTGIPATTMLEYIPWIKDCFAEPIRVEDGHYALPANAGSRMHPDRGSDVGPLQTVLRHPMTTTFRREDERSPWRTLRRVFSLRRDSASCCAVALFFVVGAASSPYFLTLEQSDRHPSEHHLPGFPERSVSA